MGAVIRRHTGNPWREEELRTMGDLRARGLSWREIAGRFQSTTGGVECAYRDYRNKVSTGHWVKRADERDEIERLVAEGETTAALAERFGVTRHSMAGRLRGMGLDAEMRREIMGVPKREKRIRDVSAAEPVLAAIAVEAGVTIKEIRGRDQQVKLKPIRHQAISDLRKTFPDRSTQWIGKAVCRSRFYVDKILAMDAA